MTLRNALLIVVMLAARSPLAVAQQWSTVQSNSPFYCQIGDTAYIDAIDFFNYGDTDIIITVFKSGDPSFEFDYPIQSIDVPVRDSMQQSGHASLNLLFAPRQDTCVALVILKFNGQTDSITLTGYRTHPLPNMGCIPFYVSPVTTEYDSSRWPMTLTNLTRDTADLTISFYRQDTTFVVPGASTLIKFQPSEVSNPGISFYPKIPGWIYDTMYLHVKNSQGDTIISVPITAGYGHWGGPFLQEFRDSSKQLPTGFYLFPLVDTGIYFCGIAPCTNYYPDTTIYVATLLSATITDTNPYVNLLTFKPFEVSPDWVFSPGGWIPFLLHPNVESVIDGDGLDSAVYFTIKWQVECSDSLPILTPDSAQIDAFFSVH